MTTAAVPHLRPAHPRVGSFQYPESLPLKDKEIVITLDDAPRPASAPALDVLTAHCVKATYFIIGKHARDYPDILRRIQAAGHTIASHSERHPPPSHGRRYAPLRRRLHGLSQSGALHKR